MNIPNCEIYQKVEDRFNLSWLPLMMTGPNAGKEPIEKDWTQFCKVRRPLSEVISHSGNLGIACGPASGTLVLDVDDFERFKTFCSENGLNVPKKTFTVQSRPDRVHLYYRYPRNGKMYGNRADKKNGFDLRGIGGQIVAAGSHHVETKNTYTVVNWADIAEAPEWLLQYSLDRTLPGQQNPEPPSSTPPLPPPLSSSFQWTGDINNLPIKAETKGLIQYGVPVGQRSEAMMTVLNALVWSNLDDMEIIQIFEEYPIGEKCREKGRTREKWLQLQIKKARIRTTSRAVTNRFNGDASESETKRFFLPGGGVKINDAGKSLGRLLAPQIYTRKGEVVEVV